MDRVDTIVSRSKKLSWLLRHGAPSVGVAMDPAGWVPIEDVLEYMKITRRALDEIVRKNNKRRLQVYGGKIRCSQGHSIECTAVTREALEASWREVTSDASIWHGTRTEVVEAIAEEGIRPQQRTHVHLAPRTNSVVGKRAEVGVLLEVSPARLRDAGFKVYAAPNGVILVRHVPPGCIVGVRAVSRRARSMEPRLRAALGLTPAA
ncbi:MAG: RNA 2'-phosphotransferase [Myxococcales bacterium]|nr:RNA 2'-phosphotransferase [Myxococcales bacterium]MCB9748984.1 RNA 2'-phosphotransferase [Myxococcales bacterium]